MKIKSITQQEATQIIMERTPRGLFLQEDKGKYIGIDNQTGDAWTEEFNSQAACVDWLNRGC